MRHVSLGRMHGMAMATCAITVAALLNGCGGDDKATGTLTPAATNTPRPTNTPVPPFTGNFASTVALDGGRTGALALAVQNSGQATGTLTISGGTTTAARFGTAAATSISLSVNGTVNLSSGAFSLTGSLTDSNGATITVDISGTLPGPGGGSGSITIQISGSSFSGTISAGTLPTPTSTQGPPTSTPTSTKTPGSDDTVTPTPSGASPTPTTGVVAGISTQFLGTFAGQAKNESLNIEKAVRIKIAVTGGTVVVTDLGGNLFASGQTITPTVTTTTTITSIKTIGGFPNGYVETLQLALVPAGGIPGIGGIYSKVALTNPTDTSNSFGLVLHPES